MPKKTKENRSSVSPSIAQSEKKPHKGKEKTEKKEEHNLD